LVFRFSIFPQASITGFTVFRMIIGKAAARGNTFSPAGRAIPLKYRLKD
jgi:hypothetical protein